MAFDLTDARPATLEFRHTPKDTSDRVAYALTKMLRWDGLMKPSSTALSMNASSRL